jgi:prevent-host-death family protein
MKNNESQISATEFKKHFLSLVEEVKTKHNSFVITKRNLPVAKVVPLEVNTKTTRKSYFGFMKGTLKISEDIVNNTFEEDWDANNG